ncbi:hypothetical protein I4U23_015260 [Adineta vaga]|nr:hypothetical protein I4U23_015260 [Adineta vaga]
MGCGNSSTVHVIPPTTKPEIISSSNQQTTLVDKSIQRISSASSKKNTRKSVTSIESHLNDHVYRPTISENNVKNPSIHSTSDVNQNIVIIWADANIDQTKKLYHDSITKLQRITPAIYTCTKSTECVNYLDNIDDKNVYLIVSDGLGEELVPLVHEKSQLEAIYIFSQVKRQRLPWANKWSQKVKEILFSMEDIFQKIKADSGLVGSLTPIIMAIIFQMEINPMVSSVPFAEVETETCHKGEKENLFSMHTVFRILGTEQLANRLWQVNLALTSDNDPQLKLLADYMRKELGEGSPLSKLGHLMIKMGEFDQAHNIYGTQLQSTDETNKRRQFHLNHQLAYVFNEKDYTAALRHAEKSVNSARLGYGADHAEVKENQALVDSIRSLQ